MLLDSFRLHVMKHPLLEKWFDRDDLPKTICLTGESGTGKIIALECSVRPMIPGEKHVSVTGNSTSVIIGQSVVRHDSVLQGAQNACEAVRSWLWNISGIDLSRMHVHFQIRSIMEGSPGQGVSGPSAGVAIVASLISELTGIEISPSIVATGTIGVKLDVGPVGGLGGHGTQTGKIVGILKSRRVKITDLVLPAANVALAEDEMRILRDGGVRIHPVKFIRDCCSVLFICDEAQLVRRIKERIEPVVRPAQRF